MKSKGLFLALVLAVGFGAAWGVLSMWVVAVAYQVMAGEECSASLLVLEDGTPAIVEHRGSNSTTYRSLDGDPIEGNADRIGHIFTPLLPPWPTEGGGSWAERLRSFGDGGNPAVFWYFVSDGGGYFVGYDSKTKARVGYLGAAGFAERLPTNEKRLPFTGPMVGLSSRIFCTQGTQGSVQHPCGIHGGKAPAGSPSAWDVYILGDDESLYHADLRARTVRQLEGLPPVRSASLISGKPDPVRGTPFRLAARTADAVVTFDAQGAARRQYPIPDSLNDRRFSFTETAAGEGLMLMRELPDPLAMSFQYQVYWVKSGGEFRTTALNLPRSTGGLSLDVSMGLILPALST